MPPSLPIRALALPCLLAGLLSQTACAQSPGMGDAARPAAPVASAPKPIPPVDLPGWLRQRLAGHGEAPVPTSVWRQLVAGQTMYYLVLPCCDQFNELWSAQGQRVCAPDGGFTGRGDGKCSESQRASDGRVQIWPATATK